MKITPEQYVSLREELESQIDECQYKRDELEELARKYFPKKSQLRPAKPKDIVEGAILYYPKDK